MMVLILFSILGGAGWYFRANLPFW
jgi:hypothetical protein